MKTEQICGIIPPVLTPFDDREQINEAELRRQVNRLIAAGVHGVFALGTNGECYALTSEEKKRVMEIVVEETNRRVPVYAGTGCVTTRETIEMSRLAQDIGVDALSVITPYFAAASQDELVDHYKAVGDSVSLPVLVYNIPARTGNAVAPATLKAIQKSAENVVGVKDSSGNFDNMKQYIELTGADHTKDFVVLSGNDSLILPALMFGGSGAIAACTNVFPHRMVAIYESYMAGDLEKAKEYQDSIRPFRNCFRFGNANTIVKMATNMTGWNVGPCRRPFSTVSEEGMKQLKKVVAEYREKGID